jgi:8-amino-3,8-dideoxy-alpha-D-manno-octulosonate transaminase
MSELQGAVALAQIRKLPAYIAAMRSAKKAVRDRLDLPDGFSLRRQPDPEGDTGIALILFAPSPDTAKALISALKEKDVSAGGRYDATVRDWHIYSNWEHILERKTVTQEGCPFTCPYYKGTLPKYSADMCPKTLDLLSRSVHIGISLGWDDAKCAEIAQAINEAAEAVA